MKKVANIKDSIMILQKEIENSVYIKASAKRNHKKIAYLKTILFYLETKPRKKFLLKELNRLNTLINKYNGQFEYWCEHVAKEIPEKDLRKTYNKETNLNLLRKQRQTIKFILE